VLEIVPKRGAVTCGKARGLEGGETRDEGGKREASDTGKRRWQRARRMAEMGGERGGRRGRDARREDEKAGRELVFINAFYGPTGGRITPYV
jgi:hypothetical protein